MCLQPKSSCTVSSSDVVDYSISSSFGLDLDADVLSAVNSLEAAAYQADNKMYRPDSDRNQSVSTNTRSRTPTRQRQHIVHAGGNPGKRKNSRSRKSGAAKPTLFGDLGGNSFLSFSPTHSPRDKKRKGCETGGDKSGRTPEKSLLALSPQKGRVLCPASPSPEPGTAPNQHVSRIRNHRNASSSSSSLPPSNPRLTSKAGSGSATASHQRGDLEQGEEIETDVSPVLTVAKPTSKSGHSDTNNSNTGATTTGNTNRVETYQLLIPKTVSSELTKEVCNSQNSTRKQSTVMGHPSKPCHADLSTAVVTVGGVEESTCLRRDSDRAVQSECVPHLTQKSPAKPKSFLHTKAGAVEAPAGKSTKTESDPFTQIKPDRRKQESPKRAPLPAAFSPAKSSTSSSTKLQLSTSSVSKSSVPSAAKSSCPISSSEASAVKSSSPLSAGFQPGLNAAHCEKGRRDAACSRSKPVEPGARRLTETETESRSTVTVAPHTSTVPQAQEIERAGIEHVPSTEAVSESNSKSRSQAADQSTVGIGSQNAGLYALV